jgi:hypothetical protein
MNKVTRTARLISALRFGFSQVTKPNVSAPARREYLQFSKKHLVDFGELPHGEIPEALKAVRPTSFEKLGNEVRVVSETWVGGQPAYLFPNSESPCW